MAKTTRKAGISGAESVARPTRRKPAAAQSPRPAEAPTSAKAPGQTAAKAALQTPAEAPAAEAARTAKAPKAVSKRAAPAARTTTRKSSTITAAPAVAADRPAAIAPMSAVELTHDEIAERAYRIYLRRNGWPGNPDHDWLQAVEELRAERRSR